VIIVSDTTPLSELAKVGQLNLLGQVFSQVIVPEEVYRELQRGNHPASQLISSLDWLAVRAVQNLPEVQRLNNQVGLDLGESEAIVLAEELKADQLLVDDLAGRREAQARGLSLIGTVGVLLVAKQRGLIEQVKPILDDLRNGGTRIAQPLYERVLVLAQEVSI
jgi:uncharacterized protein